GYLMAEAGTPKRLVALSRAWVGWMPGGLALVCLGASAFFTTFTGGSGITIVAIGGLLFPALVSDKYPERFSLGLVTAGGSLGLLFPPSLPLILYGVVAGVLIEKLFLAGILPGIVTLLALGIYGSITGVKNKMPRTAFDLKGALSTLWVAKWEVALPIVLLGGLLSGALRIHEAAAFTAFYVLVIEAFVYRDISLHRDLPRIIRESITMFGAILIILATAIGFTSYLIQAQVPMRILDAMESFISTPFMFLLLLNVFLLVVGMLMDIFSAIVVVVPLIVPIATHFGIDPYHLGIVFLLNLEIGYLTPPVGLNLFISSYRFDRPVTVLYRSVLPFVGLLLVALAITTYVPFLSTYLTTWVDLEEIPAGELELGVPEEPLEAGGDTLDDLEGGDGDGITLGDLEGDIGEITLDDLEGDDGEITLDDLEGSSEDVTLDALENADEEATLDDLEGKGD
ncbi:MAG: TRAP transporter large permease, partial [Myxococcales bacterium]|nr:TRAP transporter large permease [Myxococcales bacterium]